MATVDENYLAEIRADPDNWASKKGPDITPTIFQMSQDEIQGWADKIERLDFSHCR